MKTQSEKEKKLDSALTKLKNLTLQNPDFKNNLEDLRVQKNQLEIEKNHLEEKYQNLMNEYNIISQKLDKIKDVKNLEQKKEIEFSEKIDELNQETDTLLEEIDKWQI